MTNSFNLQKHSHFQAFCYESLLRVIKSLKYFEVANYEMEQLNY